MRKQIQLFQSSFFWILLAAIGFACLPSNALYYGLFDSTSDEIWDAMGWSAPNLSWAWFASLLLVPLLSRLFANKEERIQGIAEFSAVIAIFLFYLCICDLS